MADNGDMPQSQVNEVSEDNSVPAHETELCKQNKKAFEDRMTPAFTAEQGYQNIIGILDKSVDNFKRLAKANTDYAIIATKFANLLDDVTREEEVFYKAARKSVIEAIAKSEQENKEKESESTEPENKKAVSKAGRNSQDLDERDAEDNDEKDFDG